MELCDGAGRRRHYPYTRTMKSVDCTRARNRQSRVGGESIPKKKIKDYDVTERSPNRPLFLACIAIFLLCFSVRKRVYISIETPEIGISKGVMINVSAHFSSIGWFSARRTGNSSSYPPG